MHLYYTGECKVLVCTDLIAWGTDTVNTSHVIEYDFANDATKYIHRVGWTGWMGGIGRVTSFLKETDYDLAEEI